MQASRKRKFHLIDDGQEPPGSANNDDGESNFHIIDDGQDPLRSANINDGERRFHLIDEGQNPPGIANIDDGESRFHLINDGQNPPGSANIDDGGESVDFIGRLPDAVLGSIVSLLPTKEGARTQAISRRWRPLWRSAPLNLVAGYEYMNKGPKVVDLIPKILSEHPGPGRCFSLYICITDYYRDYYDKIGGWFSSQALDNLEELELTYSVGGKKLRPLPSSVYRFAPTLRVAKFRGCQLTNFIVQLNLEFPCLKQLTLDSVTISEDALQSMLSGCSALESIELKNKLSFARLCINSQTLKSIGFCANRARTSGFLQELVIEDAPCLERLLPLAPKYVPATIWVISAPKLKILGMLSEDITELQVGTTVFQKMIVVGLATKIHTVRVLFLGSVGPNLDAVVNFLKCFPCLERLYVIFQSRMAMDNVLKYDPLDLIDCLELHLKEVVMKNYNGRSSKCINFAKFFVLNAKVLKEMRITSISHRQQEWFAYQRRLLRIENRASRDARIEVTCGTNDNFTHNWHMHDLSMADPFDMPSIRCFKCS